MKLSLLALAMAVGSSNAFSVVPSGSSIVVKSSSSSSSTALFDSRKRQKIASRSQWIEARGLSSGGAVAATASAAQEETAGLLKNAEGLEYVQLVNGDDDASSAQIYLYGGVVTSYKKDGVEFIAVRPDAKMDGSKPISGGLSHCWPQFGPGAIQQHGFARNVNWSIKSQSDSNVVLELAPSDYTKAMWDKDFHVTFEVALEADQLSTKMIVENKGSEESFEFAAALHSYFTCSALDQLEIAGSFAGKQFLNKMAGGPDGELQTESRDVITISEEYDRVYKGVNDPVLKDAGTKKSLAVVNTAGWEDTVIWNPYGNEGMGYNNFVCVESVKFDPVTLAAGAKWEGVMALKPGSV